MARSCSPDRYAPPTPLEDLHILDYLELAGSQHRAARVLAMHQSTVCRSRQLMQSQFRLEATPGSPVCRHGHNACLLLLRLAYREHRLMEGLLRIGTDVLHQGLLLGMAGVQQVPARCRSGEHWAGLVRHGLLDGAVVSSFSLPQLQPSQEPAWKELAVFPLGAMALHLVAQAPHTRRVLLPRKTAMPLLHHALAPHGLLVDQQPEACQEAEAWVKRARDRGLALPLCSALLGPSWLLSQQLEPLAEQPPLIEQLWLLLPQQLVNTRAARLCLGHLRTTVSEVSKRKPEGSIGSQ